MNPLNYASLEASKRLIDAGIMLETDFYHCPIGLKDGDRENRASDNIVYEIRESLGRFAPGLHNQYYKRCIPAPSMAEVWRELPPQGCYLTANQGYYHAWIEWTDFEGHGKSCEAKENTNPADALIELLIWEWKEASHE